MQFLEYGYESSFPILNTLLILVHHRLTIMILSNHHLSHC